MLQLLRNYLLNSVRIGTTDLKTLGTNYKTFENKVTVTLVNKSNYCSNIISWQQ